MTASRSVEIVNKRGLHARASAKFVKMASTFDAEVTVSKDGSTVDADGYLWNAEFNGWRVVRYAPDGRIDRVIELPTRRTQTP